MSRRAGHTRHDQAQAYVYGIVPGDTVVSRRARGIGDPPERVRLVRCGDIGALVSEIDASLPLGRPADLLAHKELLDAAAGQTPVLPLRFGAVLNDTHAVRGELLAPHHDGFAAALDELDGRIQFVVKGRYVEPALLREVLADSPQAVRLREEVISAADPAAAREASIGLGEIVNTAVTGKREADTRLLGDALAPHCLAVAVRPPSHELDAAHLALLVTAGGQGDLEDALGELSESWAGRVELSLLGPLAPYDFVTTLTGEG